MSSGANDQAKVLPFAAFRYYARCLYRHFRVDGMSRVRATCHSKALILMILMYCVKNRILGKFVKNALFVVCDVTMFINRFHVPRQKYFPQNILFYGK